MFTNGETKQTIANRQIPKFEEDLKRHVDVIANKRCGNTKLYIANLRGDERHPEAGYIAKDFDPNNLIMKR